MSNLSAQPYKGTRDYYPEDKRVQNYIFDTWKQVVQSFGYEEYGAPMLEPLDVFTAKSGQELANEQTYAFTDRGGRTVAIRPEMTPSISRMVAARRQELGYPARLFSIANFMRYERPQRGREREFWQLNIDLFGVDSIAADAEIIVLADRVMKAFRATNEMYSIRINNRDLINVMMAQYLQLDAIQAQLMIKLFDRKTKISPENFRDQAIEIFGESNAAGGLKKIATLLNAKSMADLPEELRNTQVVKDIQLLFTELDNAGVKTAMFDITLMRGLDYYTGTVFEVFDKHPDNNRSMFGGGRYDGLVGLFGAEQLAAVGMGIGLTTTEIFLRSQDLLPQLRPATEITLIPVGESTQGAWDLAERLRDEGVNVEVDISNRKSDKQVRAVMKKQIPYLIFVGENESQTGLYTLKSTDGTSEQAVSFERIVTTVKDQRRSDTDFDL